MSTATATILSDNGSDANFRSWGAALAALFTTGGFFQKTTDTGQIDWATVVKPGNAAFAGFEIYKTIDSLSSTFTFYMKVEYGSNAWATPAGSLRISFGTGTNGAGVLTGNIHSGVNLNLGNAIAGQGASLFPCYASGGAGRFAILVWANLGGGALSLSVERSLDANGAYTDSYFTFVQTGRKSDNSQFVSQRTIWKPALGALTTELTNCYTFYFPFATAGLGTYAAPFPVFPFVGYPDNPMTVLCGMKSGDIAQGAPFDVIFYGVSHHYLWYLQGGGIGLGSFDTALGLGIRYE